MSEQHHRGKDWDRNFNVMVFALVEAGFHVGTAVLIAVVVLVWGLISMRATGQKLQTR